MYHQDNPEHDLTYTVIGYLNSVRFRSAGHSVPNTDGLFCEVKLDGGRHKYPLQPLGPFVPASIHVTRIIWMCRTVYTVVYESTCASGTEQVSDS